MWIFAIAHYLHLVELVTVSVRKNYRIILILTFFLFGPKIIGYQTIIPSCMGKSLTGKPEPEVKIGSTCSLQCINNTLVICRIYNNSYIPVILGCSSQHGRTANINILNSHSKITIFTGNSLFKWI